MHSTTPPRRNGGFHRPNLRPCRLSIDKTPSEKHINWVIFWGGFFWGGKAYNTVKETPIPILDANSLRYLYTKSDMIHFPISIFFSYFTKTQAPLSVPTNTRPFRKSKHTMLCFMPDCYFCFFFIRAGEIVDFESVKPRHHVLGRT